MKQTMRRNFGIIAHVDAGKTTVTERILHYCGAIKEPGEVHHGATTTDSDSREIAHKITISAAAISVKWKGYDLTLIDTPGHIDFNVEVKRSLRVLDGAVVVFDAVAGVEPQSETNWRLADEFELPRIAFINKMDRRGADFHRTVGMIEEIFGAHTVPLHLPVEKDGVFVGVVCPFSDRLWTWSGEPGAEMSSQAVPSEYETDLNEAWAAVMEAAALFNEDVMTAWVANSKISSTLVKQSIRKGVLAGKLVPVVCGSALANTGIDQLLNVIVGYLPAPEERPWSGPESTDAVVAYAFKTTTSDHGALTYCRVYQGVIEPKAQLTNTMTGKVERISGCFRMHANKANPITLAESGDIVTISGLKDTSTGQTLCSAGVNFALESMDYPSPVTTVALELPDSQARDKVAVALDRLRKEDPTLVVSTDEESGQLLLSGIGELHLEMVREKLEDLTGYPLQTGAPEVAYRETITCATEVRHLRKKQTGGPGERAEVQLKVEPTERGSGVSFASTVSGGAIAAEYIPAVERGIRNRLGAGVVDGNPVIDLHVELMDGKMHSNDSSAIAFEAAGAEAIAIALHQARSVLLEPIMWVEIQCPDSALGSVMGDLARRRGVVREQAVPSHRLATVSAEVPLAQMFGYAGDLRSLSSGRASFAMRFDRYDRT